MAIMSRCTFWVCLQVAGVCLRCPNVGSFCRLPEPPPSFVHVCSTGEFCFLISCLSDLIIRVSVKIKEFTCVLFGICIQEYSLENLERRTTTQNVDGARQQLHDSLGTERICGNFFISEGCLSRAHAAGTCSSPKTHSMYSSYARGLSSHGRRTINTRHWVESWKDRPAYMPRMGLVQEELHGTSHVAPGIKTCLFSPPTRRRPCRLRAMTLKKGISVVLLGKCPAG